MAIWEKAFWGMVPFMKHTTRKKFHHFNTVEIQAVKSDSVVLLHLVYLISTLQVRSRQVQSDCYLDQSYMF